MISSDETEYIVVDDGEDTPGVVLERTAERIIAYDTPIATGSIADELAKVSSNDTTASFLENKIVAGSGIAVATLNDGANETLQISAPGSTTDELVGVSAADTTPGYLSQKVVAGALLTATVLTPAGDEDLQLDVDEASIDHTAIANIGTNTHAAIDAHIADTTTNPHAVDLGTLGTGTLAELNALVTDATLDDSGDARTPTAHAASHAQAGADALDPANLAASGASGEVLTADGVGGASWAPTTPGVTDHGALTGLGDDDHPQYLLVDGTRAMTGALDLGTNAVTNVGNVDGRDVSADGATLDGHVADGTIHFTEASIDHTAIQNIGVNSHAQIDSHIADVTTNPHAVDLGTLGSGTLAELNALVTDATLDDSGDPRTPTAHASTHLPSGSDPLTTAAAVELTDATNAEGIAESFARSDHQHSHGIRGGGSLHALVIASGAAGFMSGADKAKLDGVAAGASATFTGLSDTAGAITANQFARANAGGTSVDFFDLFGSANTWSAAQTIAADLNMGGDVLPTTNNTRDIGSDALSWGAIWSRKLIAVEQSGNGTISDNAARGGLIAGRAVGASGSPTLDMSGGGFPPTALIGNAYTSQAGHTAQMTHAAGGGFMTGSAYCSAGGTKTAVISSAGSAYASFTGGYAWAYGSSGASATISNNAAAAFLWAYCAANSGTHLATTVFGASGAFVQGRLQGNGSHTLSAAGAGSFVQGLLSGSGSCLIETTAQGDGGFAQGKTNNGGTIRSSQQGAFAQGNVNGAGAITASGAGSFAHGNVTTGSITSSGAGSFAVGSAGGNAITASATNAIQFGIGTNALADSLQVGNGGLRLKGTAGAPGTPQNGDIWVASGYTYIRSNGVSVKIT